jgi:UDP-GlcNAc:undecaprenyl-phosphate/decaprenyl-phosphate GlcNAc-1-phosphate transferase
MPPIKLFNIFLTALMASLLVMPSLYNLSIKVGCVDMPDDGRKIHAKAVPRLGGIAIQCGLLLSVLLFCSTSSFVSGFVAGGLLIFFVGIIDDLRNLTPVQKLAGQIIGTSIGVILSQNYIQRLGEFLSSGNIELSSGITIPFTIFCIVGLINSLNMIDGLDGLAGGVSAIASLALAILAFETGALQVFFVCIALLGAVVGFLVHNAYPARIFMGDAGSNLLGFALGMIAVKLIDVSPTVSPAAILIILSVPLFDMLYVVSCRLIDNRPVMSADKGHLHHRLLDIGLGHRASVLLVFGWSYFMAAAGVLYYNAGVSLLIPFLIITTSLFYLLLFVLSKYRSKGDNQIKTDAPFLKVASSISLERFCNRLLFVARYLIVIFLAMTFSIDLAPDPYHTIALALLLCLLMVGFACNGSWANQLLLISLYLTGAYLLYEVENSGRSVIIADISILTLSAHLFALLALIVGIKIIIRKRFNILTSSAIELFVLLAVIFVPLLPDEITARYHLLVVAGKSIILFVAYKLILISKDAKRNRVVILFSIATLFINLVNRII